MKDWRTGKLSNFDYLMTLNDFCGRSFNDMSQYYIFPWTITNFQTANLDEAILSSK